MSSLFEGDFQVLDFYHDNETSCALTALINNVRFHLIAEGSKVRKGRSGQEYSRLLQAVKEASSDEADEDLLTAESGAADSGIEVDGTQKETDGEQQKPIPTAGDRLHRWLLGAASESIHELASSSRGQQEASVEDWFNGETHFFDISSKDGEITATELEETDELRKRVSGLLPEMTIPKYIHKLDMRYFSASDLTVLATGAMPAAFTRPSLVRTHDGGSHFLKLIDPTQPGPTKREISVLAKISSKGLRSKISCPELVGLVGIPTDFRTKIVGFLQTAIPNPVPLTTKLDTSVPQDLRDQWADEAERIVNSLHESGIVWGDAKADNFMVDETNKLWIIDFGGSYTEGWVDPNMNETEEGDDMGVEKIENALHDPVQNTWDPDTEVSYGGSHKMSADRDEPRGTKRAASEGSDSDSETDIDEDASEPSPGHKRQRLSSPLTSPVDEPSPTEEEQPQYCYCHKPSSGKMIGCDGDNCKQQWFHFECAGLEEAPTDGQEWFCQICA